MAKCAHAIQCAQEGMQAGAHAMQTTCAKHTEHIKSWIQCVIRDTYVLVSAFGNSQTQTWKSVSGSQPTKENTWVSLQWTFKSLKGRCYFNFCNILQ